MPKAVKIFLFFVIIIIAAGAAFLFFSKVQVHNNAALANKVSEQKNITTSVVSMLNSNQHNLGC